eukprot:TRINITY_DN5704_c0_g1_i1.p1 TRINITY_DN5704_c0_g1~~TRINITY_DN5704_c0_g1_i1.p1  ORF type:complete len:383 (+),score=141.98 TRINITY_DN5704_c0_g1_i1:170-1318(+)
MADIAPELSDALSELAPTFDGLGLAYSNLELDDQPCAEWAQQLALLEYVTHLSVQGAGMQDDEAAHANQLKHLIKLSLGRNALTRNPLSDGSHLFIQELVLSNNQIGSLESLDLSACCPVLHTLDLSNNLLCSLEGLRCTEQLKVLSVGCNQLASISGAQCKGVTYLNASQNRIEQLEAPGTAPVHWAQSFSELVELDLCGNLLGSQEPISGFTVPGSFGKVSVLDLSHNKLGSYAGLTALGAWWSHESGEGGWVPLRALTTLKMAQNPLTSSPEDEEAPGFDEAKHPVEVLCYLPRLTQLDSLPEYDEDGELVGPFGTEEQLEEAKEKRTQVEDEEKEAKRKADEEEAARVAAEEEAARIAAEEEAARLAAEELMEGETDE